MGISHQGKHRQVSTKIQFRTLNEMVDRQEFSELPITLPMAFTAGLLPLHHLDPFDRMLVSQAQKLNIPILSADKVLDLYEVKRLC
jgi:PIN domain nuclease of toxin-antitoxin system